MMFLGPNAGDRPEAQEALLGPSVHARDEPVANSPAVLFPRRAVLPPALAHVPGVSVHQQDDEVDHVVPGQEVVEACVRGENSGGYAGS